MSTTMKQVRKPDPMDAVRADEAAILLHARRVARWMLGWRPRLRGPEPRLLFVGGGDLAGLVAAEAASARILQFDPEHQSVELIRSLGRPDGSVSGPEVFDAVVERLCLEVYLADVVVILPAAPASIALATAGAVDGLGGHLVPAGDGLAAALRSALAAWSPPSEVGWAPAALAEPATAGRLGLTLGAALSAPLAAL